MELKQYQKMKALINSIIKQLNDVQKGKIWIGTNFNKKMNALNENDVFIKLSPKIHSVAELISHLTFWRKETILKIKTQKSNLTEESEENWLTNEQLKEIGWGKIKEEYNNSLVEIIQLIQHKNDSFLNEIYYDSDYKGKYNYLFLIEGMLHHDIYHLGQIGMIVNLIKKK